MGSSSVNKSGRSKKLNPGLRARIEQSRKRFQCDLLGFWRQCGRDNCWQRHRCTGNPFECFKRRHAAMPRDHEDWWRAEFLLRTRGAGTAEETLRTAGVPMPRAVRPKRGDRPPALRAGAAAPAIAPATAAVAAPESEAERRVHRRDAFHAKLAPRDLVRLDAELRELGTLLQTLESQTLAAQAIEPQTIEPQAIAPQAIESDMVEWTPMTGSAVDPVRAMEPAPAGTPPSREAGEAPRVTASERESPASPSTAAAEQAWPAAGPSPPVRPPGVRPREAWCDEAGRLHVPDTAEFNERIRSGLTWSEIVARGRV